MHRLAPGALRPANLAIRHILNTTRTSTNGVIGTHVHRGSCVQRREISVRASKSLSLQHERSRHRHEPGFRSERIESEDGIAREQHKEEVHSRFLSKVLANDTSMSTCADLARSLDQKVTSAVRNIDAAVNAPQVLSHEDLTALISSVYLDYTTLCKRLETGGRDALEMMRRESNENANAIEPQASLLGSNAPLMVNFLDSRHRGTKLTPSTLAALTDSELKAVESRLYPDIEFLSPMTFNNLIKLVNYDLTINEARGFLKHASAFDKLSLSTLGRQQNSGPALIPSPSAIAELRFKSISSTNSNELESPLSKLPNVQIVVDSLWSAYWNISSKAQDLRTSPDAILNPGQTQMETIRGLREIKTENDVLNQTEDDIIASKMNNSNKPMSTPGEFVISGDKTAKKIVSNLILYSRLTSIFFLLGRKSDVETTYSIMRQNGVKPNKQMSRRMSGRR